MPLKTPNKKKNPNESVIRQMTRISMKYNAVNLSQGFPNEPPPSIVSEALAKATLYGTTQNASSTDSIVIHRDEIPFKGGVDELNQYSIPFGRASLRNSISEFYKKFYSYGEIDPETNITVTCGATEAMASCLRSIGSPGDKIAFFQPFHELYPSQCKLYYLEPVYITLKPPSINDNNTDKKTWTFDWNELEKAMSESTALVLNSPHNPTGKVFTKDELIRICKLAISCETFIITDEIYEFMCHHDGKEKPEHFILPQIFPEIKNQVFLCNSIGKSCSATGWRVGWCIHPSDWSSTYRSIHDQSVVMAPHPMQYATEIYLTKLPLHYFHNLGVKYHQRLLKLFKSLKKVGFELCFPQGAYYLFAKYRNVSFLQKFEEPMDAAIYMIEHVGVACVPGDNFYNKECDLSQQEGKQYLRFAACRSMSDMEEACVRIESHSL